MSTLRICHGFYNAGIDNEAFNGFARMYVETWKRHPDHIAYDVSNYGRVRRATQYNSTVIGKVLQGGVDRDGYPRVVLSAPGGKLFYKKVHTLVLETFVGPAPDGYCACHFDGDVKNNRLENLRWDTMTGNHRDKYRHGTMSRGSRHGLAKLDESAVAEIKRAIETKSSTHLQICKRTRCHKINDHKHCAWRDVEACRRLPRVWRDGTVS